MKLTTNKGTVNTEKAITEFDLDRWDGSNRCSGQGLHETLYKSKKDVWYILHTSQWQGSYPSVEFITEDEAWGKLIDSDYEEKEYEKFFPNVFVVEMHESEI